MNWEKQRENNDTKYMNKLLSGQQYLELRDNEF